MSFFDNLKAKGLFVRDYDGVCQERLPRIARELHAELCQLDPDSMATGWKDLTVAEFVNAWVDSKSGLRKI